MQALCAEETQLAQLLGVALMYQEQSEMEPADQRDWKRQRAASGELRRVIVQPQAP